MDIVARADGGAGAGGDIGGGGSEGMGAGPAPEPITVTGSRIEDSSGGSTSVNVGGSFTSMLDGLNGTSPAAPAGGGTNLTVTYHRGSTSSASSQGSDQAGQSSSDGSSSASPAPGTSGWDEGIQYLLGATVALIGGQSWPR